MKLFVIQPFISHYYPTFSLARIDVENSVMYTTIPTLNSTIENEGFITENIDYMPEYILKNFKVFVGLLLKNLVSSEDFIKRKNEFENSFKQVTELVKRHSPSEVYIDQSLAEYYYFFKPFVPKITIIHTKVYSGKTKGIPPMSSTYIPKQGLLSRIKINYLWFIELRKLRFKEFLLKLAFLGKDEIYLWKKHCENYGINWKKHIDFKHSLNRGIKGIENIVLLPRHLEFENFKPKQNITFFDLESVKNESSFYTPEYESLKSKYFINKKLRIVYMAFGTLVNGPKIVKFFTEVMSIIKELTHTVLLISTGKQPINLKAQYGTFIFDFVPQQDVLKYSDLFITHGGLGSVKEAFHAQVPMLVVPINKKIDQPGNAARVKASGYGEFLNIDSYNISELRYKINFLLKKTNKN